MEELGEVSSLATSIVKMAENPSSMVAKAFIVTENFIKGRIAMAGAKFQIANSA